MSEALAPVSDYREAPGYGEIALGESARRLAANRAQSYLVCVLSGMYLGIEALAVREIMPMPAWTPVAGMPPLVVGIVDVRGRIEESLIGRHSEVFTSTMKPRGHKLMLGDHSRVGVLPPE